MRGVRRVIHVGDFGLWPGPDGAAFVRAVDKLCRRYGQTLEIVPGNHEDWRFLTAEWSSQDRDHGRPLSPVDLTERISVLPRGHRFEIAGRSFVALGGAPSIDFEFRTEGVDWWPEEAITDADVRRVVEGGPADVMLTHDSPAVPLATTSVAEIMRTNPMGWSSAAVEYADQGSVRVTNAVLGVEPKLLVHGHFHVADEAVVTLPSGREMTVVSLPDGSARGNARLLDVESLAVI